MLKHMQPSVYILELLNPGPLKPAVGALYSMAVHALKVRT